MVLHTPNYLIQQICKRHSHIKQRMLHVYLDDQLGMTLTFNKIIILYFETIILARQLPQVHNRLLIVNCFCRMSLSHLFLRITVVRKLKFYIS